MSSGTVEQRTYQGKIDPVDMAQALATQFEGGDTRAQWVRGERGRAILQVQGRRVDPDDPTVAVTLHITPTESGGAVISMSEQQWWGVAADLAKSGMLTLLNPWNLLGELDDIARNFQRIQLRDEIWQAVETYCRNLGSGGGVAPQAQHVICPYCGTPNPLGTLTCQSCHAPLTKAQPITCPRCGFVNEPHAGRCVNCGVPFKD